MTTVCYPPGADWSCFGDEEVIAVLDPEKKDLSEARAWLALGMLTGWRVGVCPVTVRPCIAGCRPPGTYITAPVDAYGNYAGVRPGTRALFSPHVSPAGVWVNSCGCSSPSDCSCTTLCEVILPGTVGDIVEVVLDGAVLDPDAYRVDNGNRLVRTDGGCWPACQDMAKPGGATYEPIVVENVSSRITYTREGKMVHVLAETTGAPGSWGSAPWTSKGASTTAVYAPGGGQVGSFNTNAGSKTINGSVGLLFAPFEMAYETTDPASPADLTSTFSVTYYQGASPDNVILNAVGMLAAEFYHACSGEECRLPSGVVNVVRQGISIELQGGLFPGGRTNIPEVDLLIEIYNPFGLRVAPVIASPDTVRPRMTTVGRR